MTELIWEGKYDKDGRRVAPLRIALPFQTVETVNESAQQRQLALDLFSAGRPAEWRNRLIWGDKKYVLPALLDEFAGQVNLIYIDPPFNVGADFSFTAAVPPDFRSLEDFGSLEESLSFTKEPSVIELKAYRDTWGRGLDSYLQWFYETVVLLRELLAEDGSIYVHLDWHVGHYAKVVLDEVFLAENFRNEIVWQRSGAHNDANRFGIIHDTIFFYSKSSVWNFQPVFTPYEEKYIRERFRSVEEETGRRYWLNTLTAAGGGPPRYFNGVLRQPPPGTHWRFSQEKIDQLIRDGRIVFTESGMPYVKQYLDESPGRPAQSLWTDLVPSKSGHERLDYATQKPEALLERILRASSNEGDLVLDCFCGSGTTPAVAEKLGRRWIACDLSRFAIHTTRKRLLGIETVRPFVVQNLGKYERQVWQAAEFGSERVSESASQRGAGEAIRDAQLAYRKFILDLYHARPVSGYIWLHGVRRGRMVHVGAVDAPVSAGDVTQMIAEFKRAVGSGADAPASNGIDVLGWDFAFELNEIAKQQAAQAKVDLRFLRIPRDVMDKRAVEQGDIRFFELAALSVEVAVGRLPKSGRLRESGAPTMVTLTLTDFVIPPDDVPEDVQRAITHWSQWIDYWAVDWDNQGDTFHNEWQTYRTRKSRELRLTTTHTYDAPGEYTVVVKVIDILGNDTARTVKGQLA